MNWTLFKTDLKNNAVLLAIISAVLMLYFSVMASMFEPADTTALSSMFEMLPEGLRAGLGFDSVPTNLTGFMTNYYYGFIVFVFPMIYCIIAANRLVAKLVDNGSFAYLLMSPVSRRKIIVTKGVFLLCSIALLFVILHICGGAVCRLFFGDMLNRHIFLRLNINAALLTMLVGMICFFYSCLFNDSKQALAYSAGVNIGFLLLFILGRTSSQSEFLKDMSIYAMLDTQRLLEGNSTSGLVGILIAAILLLFGLSVWIFDRKNLPI